MRNSTGWPALGSGLADDPTRARAEQLRRDLLEAAARYRDDPWAWYLEQVVTVDQATRQERRWPDWAYLHDLVTVLQHEQRVALPKARRMLVTWTIALWALHQARHVEHFRALWLSRIEDTAADTVDEKIAWAEDHLVDPRLRLPYEAHRTARGKRARLCWHHARGDSEILGLASGADVVRSYTASLIVFDEVEFQLHGGAALDAINPLIEEGKPVQLILLSSSNGSSRPLAEICARVGITCFR